MKKGILFLADGFEATEAIATTDVLLRTHQIELQLVSIQPSKEVTASNGLVVKADCFLKDIKPEDYDFLILPGGKKGVENLSDNEIVLLLVKKYLRQGKGVYAICAAPSILGKLHLLNGRNYTCFPGFECEEGHYQEKEGVVIDENLITARSMAFSIPFGEAIAEKEVGKETLESAKPGMYGLSVD